MPLAWLADLGADAEALNPNGGAIALGIRWAGPGAADDHAGAPHARQRRPLRVQTMCEGGGQANATIRELL